MQTRKAMEQERGFVAKENLAKKPEFFTQQIETNKNVVNAKRQALGQFDYGEDNSYPGVLNKTTQQEYTDGVYNG